MARAATAKAATKSTTTKSTGAKKAPIQKTATKRAPAPAAAAPTKAPARRGRAVPPHGGQMFTVSHLKDAVFASDGLRPYAAYRDLGFAAATDGLCQAHVIRFTEPCSDDVRVRHAHDVELQMIYVLKGWIKNEFEDHGEQLMQAGSCWLQPKNIKHTVLDYSKDCEMLEIIVPANFTTSDL